MSQTITQQIDQAASRNAFLLNTLSETDGAPALFQEQVRLIAELQTLLKNSEETSRRLERARDKELKDHEKYRDSTARRFLHKAFGKRAEFEEKAAKEEREYFEALQNLHREENTTTSLRAQIDEATVVREEYQADLDRRAQAQRDLDTLYSDIFGGHTQGFPEEDVKERASEAALQAYHDKRTAFETEQQVAKRLRGAVDQLRLAVAQMDSALSYSQADIIGFDSAAYVKRNCLHKAEAACAEARIRIMQAQALNPSIRDLPQVSIDQGGILMDVVFDNVFSDLDFHQRIKTSKQSVLNCRNALAEIAAESVARQQVLIDDLNLCQTVLNDTRRELQEERAAIFARVVGSQGETTAAPASSTEVDVQADTKEDIKF